MTNNPYRLRSQDSSEDGGMQPLPPPPGTSGQAIFVENMTPLKLHLSPTRDTPGCHPSRWLWELFNNDFTSCDMFERAKHAGSAIKFPLDHTHRLVFNGNQSYVTDYSRQLSSVCLSCGFHFVFMMKWEEEHSHEKCLPVRDVWPPDDHVFPWHHIVWVHSDSDTNIAASRTKYYPLLAREFFVCGSAPCTLEITLEVSEPRIADSLEPLTDYDAIKEQLESAKAADPERYADIPDTWIRQAPMNLNTYLKNQLETPEDQVPRSIAKRNKRFHVLFGPRCYDLFKNLEFAEEGETDDGSFKPKVPEPANGHSGTTRLGTYRAFIEDARSEVQCLIHTSGGVAEPPTYCSGALHADLSCTEHINVGNNPLTRTERYRLIGVLPSQERGVIANAFKRQWGLMPRKRRALVDALVAIANDVNDERLSVFAMTQESLFVSNPYEQRTVQIDDGDAVKNALYFFGLPRPNRHSSETVVAAFRNKIAQNAACAADARSMLLVLAGASSDDSYQAKLLMESDSKMSSTTAKIVLGIEVDDFSNRYVVTVTSKKVAASKSEEETRTYLDAAQSIAAHVDSAQLQAWCYEQRSQHLESETGNNPSKPVDFSIPVGLHNIGNTCYLNSLLQYLYTVKPVRDLVMDYEPVKLNLEDDEIQHRRIGGHKMQIDRGEAVVARAFTEELGNLFQTLSTSEQASSRPSQRLANAVLLSTHTLLHEAKAVSKAPISQPPPPLPARPSPAAPDEQTALASNAPQTDAASDTTLVESATGTDDLGSEFVKIKAPSVQETHEVVDVEMEETALISKAPVTGLGDTPEERNEDTAMADLTTTTPQGEESVDQKVLTALEHQKRSSGTDQQDVEEVMGSMINRLQAAIRPRAVDEATGIQLEALFDTFFVTTINYTKKFDEEKYQSEVSFDRSITAFPAPTGSCTLYEALGRNFDEQILEDSKLSRYTVIKKLPPILHVLIQRSQLTGGKNNNHVTIPETLHLGPYMDAPHDSAAFQRQVKHWVISDRLADIQAQIATVREADFKCLGAIKKKQMSGMSKNEDCDIPTLDRLIDAQSQEDWSFDGANDDDYVLITRSNISPVDKLHSPPEDYAATGQLIQTNMNEQVRELEEALEHNFDESERGDPYRLHAVICHRGGMTSGHYWVWIHDFEKRIWRKYNDDVVQENPDTEAVLKELSSSGEPYYLCYVKEDIKDAFVDVPKRQVPVPPTQSQGEAELVSI